MARRRYELTDREWQIIEPLLPNKPRGVPRVDDRRVLNGILWRIRSLAKTRGMGPAVGVSFRRLQRRTGDDRFNLYARSPARCDREKDPIGAGRRRLRHTDLPAPM